MLACRSEVLCRICKRKHVLDHSDWAVPTRQHELNHTRSGIYSSICPERSSSCGGNLWYVRGVQDLQGGEFKRRRAWTRCARCGVSWWGVQSSFFHVFFLALTACDKLVSPFTAAVIFPSGAHVGQVDQIYHDLDHLIYDLDHLWSRSSMIRSCRS